MAQSITPSYFLCLGLFISVFLTKDVGLFLARLALCGPMTSFDQWSSVEVTVGAGPIACLWFALA